ncbi:aminotransferase class IV [Rapidithrix thailandica]|uniref:branched-chain-amino-acid transaminase n=1 Tax=Rapidithrix thailandica TaxID=413964 RepID=A0AAW9SHB4_9BACT
MHISYNFRVIPSTELKIPYSDRAFQYGDGLFETMVFQYGKVCYFQDHMYRLRSGMKAFSFDNLQRLDADLIFQHILQLVQYNRIEEQATVKIQVWRKEGGKYSPQSNDFNILISLRSRPGVTTHHPIHLGISQTSQVTFSLWSQFKTCNALPYILAGIEKQQSPYDDLILLNQQGYLSECIASNLYWIKRDCLYTPSIQTGCVSGIFRKNLLRSLQTHGIPYQEVEEKAEVLHQADHVFTTNVQGIVSVNKVMQNNYTPLSSSWLAILENKPGTSG